MDTTQHSKWSRYRPPGKFLLLGVLLAFFALGYYAATFQHSAPSPDRHQETSQVAAQGHQQDHKKVSQAMSQKENSTFWTCVMHPHIRLPEPGQCPICGMNLVPVKSDVTEPETDVVRYTMSEAAKKLAEVETAEVKRRKAYVSIRMVGLVFEDETRIASLTSRVDGRLDEIHVDFTGVKVAKGDPMVTIWSPTLIRSQVELFETIRSPEYGESVIRGAEERLKQFGLTDDQIRQIRESKKPTSYITLRAPINGIVMKKNVVLGDFVKEGTVMYEISDLSKVWIKLDAYETDLPWIRYGQEVTFTTPAIPGRRFHGTVVFIDPMLQMSTRSVKIRVEADNPDLALKPNMFVTAELEAEVDDKGRVINSEWAGKYICPVDPKVVSSEPGVCPGTDLPLKPAESFGYSPDKDPELPVVIPATAVLYTGKRSVVYVQVPGRNMPTYEMRHVVLGPRAGDTYVVFDGLRPGERVVTKGNFKIDSATQILARPSMMSPEKVAYDNELLKRLEQDLSQERIEAPPAFGAALYPIFDEYLHLKDAVAKGETHVAMKSARRLNELIHKADIHLLDMTAQDTWNRIAGKIASGLARMAGSMDQETARIALRQVSEGLAALIVGFWQVIDKPLLVFNCPADFDNKGAYWVEERREFTNPYRNADATTCGNLVLTIPPGKVGQSVEAKHAPDASGAKHESADHQGPGTKHEPAAEGSESKVGGKEETRSSPGAPSSHEGSDTKATHPPERSGSKHDEQSKPTGTTGGLHQNQGTDVKHEQPSSHSVGGSGSKPH